MSITVTAVFLPVPGLRDELLQELRRFIADVHQEPGCDLFALHDAADETFVLIEKWTTEQNLDDHAAAAPVARFNAAIAALVEAPPVVTRMTAVPAGTERQGVL